MWRNALWKTWESVLHRGGWKNHHHNDTLTKSEKYCFLNQYCNRRKICISFVICLPFHSQFLFNSNRIFHIDEGRLKCWSIRGIKKECNEMKFTTIEWFCFTVVFTCKQTTTSNGQIRFVAYARSHTHTGYVNTHIRKLIAPPGAYACCFFFTAMPNVFNMNDFVSGIIVNGLLLTTDKNMLLFYIFWWCICIQNIQYFDLFLCYENAWIIIPKTCKNLLLLRFHLIVCIWGQ